MIRSTGIRRPRGPIPDPAFAFYPLGLRRWDWPNETGMAVLAVLSGAPAEGAVT